MIPVERERRAGDVIEAGLSGEKTWNVANEHLASRHGSGLVDVLATPALVAFCEETARALVDPRLPDGRTTVGTSIELRHLAPTPPGMQITVLAKLREVDGRRLRFDVEVRDEVEPIGRGTHERFIVDLDRFQRRIAEKSDSGGH